MKIIGIKVAAFLLALFPVIASAKDAGFGGVDTFIGRISSFISNTLIPLVFGLALLVFIWGMFKYFILGGGEEESRNEGKQLMLWSIIGFVVMVSIFGIVNLLSSGLGLADQQNIQNIPNVPTSNN